MNKNFFAIINILIIVQYVILLLVFPTNAEDNTLSIKQIVDNTAQELLKLDGITGLSYTDTKPHKIIVYIENDEYRNIVPDKIEGYNTMIRVSGEVTCLSDTNLSKSLLQMMGIDRTRKIRPPMGGISCGAYQWIFGNTGTLGIITTYKNWKILSNAHVIAMNCFYNYLPKGTILTQPGTYKDGGTKDDKIGTLQEYVPLRWGWIGLLYPNHVDVACGDLLVYSHLEKVLGWNGNSLYQIKMNNPREVIEGDKVGKSGRTSGVSYNIVCDSHAWARVRYGLKFAIFEDTIMVINSFLEDGDSGSVVWIQDDSDNHFVGLGFAGSNSYSYVCKAKYIIDELTI